MIALATELNAERLLIEERGGGGEADQLGSKITGVLGALVEVKSNHIGAMWDFIHHYNALLHS